MIYVLLTSTGLKARLNSFICSPPSPSISAAIPIFMLKLYMPKLKQKVEYNTNTNNVPVCHKIGSRGYCTTADFGECFHRDYNFSVNIKDNLLIKSCN